MNHIQKLDQKIILNGIEYEMADIIDWDKNKFFSNTFIYYYKNRSFKKREFSQCEFEDYCTCNTISEYLHENDLSYILRKEFKKNIDEIKRELTRLKF